MPVIYDISYKLHCDLRMFCSQRWGQQRMSNFWFDVTSCHSLSLGDCKFLRMVNSITLIVLIIKVRKWKRWRKGSWGIRFISRGGWCVVVLRKRWWRNRNWNAKCSKSWNKKFGKWSELEKKDKKDNIVFLLLWKVRFQCSWISCSN